MDSLEGGPRHRASSTFCNTCYAWASFLIWTLIVFLLVFGIAFFAFIRYNLPEIKVHRIDVYKLNVTKHEKNKGAQLAIDVQVMINVTNNNKKMALVYGKMSVETMVGGFRLPKVSVDGFRQNAMRANDLKIHPEEARLRVKNDEVKELELTAEQHELVLKIKMLGKIQFWYKGRVMTDLHLRVSCEGVEQSQIDQAVEHECYAKLGIFSG